MTEPPVPPEPAAPQPASPQPTERVPPERAAGDVQSSSSAGDGAPPATSPAGGDDGSRQPPPPPPPPPPPSAAAPGEHAAPGGPAAPSGPGGPGAAAAWDTPFASRFGLVRPVHGRYFAGVCAAIGRATNTDPVLWRILLAVLTLFGGVGLAAYLAGWLLIPSEGDTASPAEALLGRGTSQTPPLLVIAVGVIALPMLLFVFSDGFRPALLGLGLLLGAALVLTRRVQAASSGQRPPGSGGPPYGSGAPQYGYGAPQYGYGQPGRYGYGPAESAASAGDTTVTMPATPTPGAAGGPPPAASDPTVMLQQTVDPTLTAPGFPPVTAKPPLAPRGPYASSNPYPPGGNPYASTSPYAASLGYAPPPARGTTRYPGLSGMPVTPRPRPPRPPRERSLLGRFTISLLCLALGVLAVLDISGGGDLRPSTYLAVAIGVIALGLLVGAWAGRARWLIPIGILLSIALAITSFVERWDVPNATGNQTWVPSGIDQVNASYEARFGNGLLDLRQVDFADRNVTFNVTSKFGNFEVILPDSVDAKVTATVKFGSAIVFRDNWGGSTHARTVTDEGSDGEGGGRVSFDATVKFGNLEVHR